MSDFIPPRTVPRLRALGAMELVSGTTPLLPNRRKVLAALVYLARHQGFCSRSALAALFWGERDEARARQSLRNTLSELRGALGVGLDADEQQVRLLPGAVAFDVADFETAVRNERWAQAADAWAGEFLPGAEDLGTEEWRAWLERERSALHGSLAWAFARLTEQAARAGTGRDVAAWALRWSEALPGDEEALVRLVEALLESGRGAEASARHAAFVSRLGDLGVEPSHRILLLAERMAGEQSAKAGGGQARQALLTPVLIERDGALARLTAAWHAAISGAGQVVLVEADDGLGKSRLARELVRAVRREHPAAAVLEARAYASERNHPWSTLRVLVKQLSAAPGLGAAPPDALNALTVLDPELRQRFPGLPDSGGAGAIEDAFSRVVGELAVEAPVLLLLDDAPLADSPSLAAIARLLHHLPRRVMLVLTGRSEALAASPLAGDVRQTGSESMRIELGPLDREAAARLVGSMAPLSPDSAAALIPPLYQAAGGVPGFLVDTVTRLADDGTLAIDQDGQWRLTVPVEALRLGPPAGVQEATLARLNRLSPDARRVLEAAAVIGPVVESERLEAVAGLPPKPFQEALADLLLGRMLRASTGGSGALEFSSEATRRVVYDLIVPSLRRLLHRRTARVLRSMARGEEERIRWHRDQGKPAGREGRWAAGLSVLLVLLALAFRLQGTTKGEGEPAVVVLADPRNATGDSVFDRSMASAAAVGLGQSRRVSLFPRNRVLEVLRRMGRSADSGFSESLAREVAERENLRAVVALAIDPAPQGYLLSLRLVEPSGGGDLWAGREETSREQVLEALDRLLRRTRRALGESRADLAADPQRLPQVTTSSLEALKAYADGRLAWSRREYEVAEAYWSRAVQLDTAFAMAYAALADYGFNRINKPAEGERYLSRALALTDRLTEREQLVLRLSAARYRGRPFEAVTLARLQAERYPERDTWLTLAYILMRQERCGEAVPAVRQALGFDSAYPSSWITLATCHQILDQPDSALAAYGKADRLDSTILRNGNLNQEWGRVLVRLGQLNSADSAFRLMLAHGGPNERGRGHRSLGFLAMYRGQYAEAARQFRTAALLSRQSRSQLSEARNRILLAEVLITGGDPAAARRELEIVDSLLYAFRPQAPYYFYAGHAWARAGVAARAARMLRRLDSLAPQDDVYAESALRLSRGQQALMNSQPRQALEAVAGDRLEAYAAYRHAIRAEAYHALGRYDSAMAAAGEAARGFHFGYDSQDEWLRAEFRIGQAALARRDTAAAIAAWSAYAQRWKDGDSTLPELVLARDRLQRLRPASR